MSAELRPGVPAARRPTAAYGIRALQPLLPILLLSLLLVGAWLQLSVTGRPRDNFPSRSNAGDESLHLLAVIRHPVLAPAETTAMSSLKSIRLSSGETAVDATTGASKSTVAKMQSIANTAAAAAKMTTGTASMALASMTTAPKAVASYPLIKSSTAPLPSTSLLNRTAVVLVWTKIFGWSFEHWLRQGFLSSWPCSRFCNLTFDQASVQQADAVIFHACDYWPSTSPSYRSPSQLWILFNLEPPTGKYVTTRHDNVFNLTMTYHNDSDIPVHYGHYSAVADNRIVPHTIRANFEKRKPYAYWMVSNCDSQRMKFVGELSKYVKVDIFGKCASVSRQCESPECEQERSASYAFYLAFENSLCPDYVTEKLWRTLASSGGAIPIVIGAPRRYYEAVAPPNSYIHAENFTSLRQLGAFMSKVASNRDSFLYYQRWRTSFEAHAGDYNEFGRGVCRLCELLHNGKLSSAPAKTELSRWANAGCTYTWPSMGG